MIERNDGEALKQLFLPPDAKWDNPLMFAAKIGADNIVKLLLPRSDPAWNESEVLREVVKGGHLNVVKLLLKDGRADPTAHQSEALRIAT